MLNSITVDCRNESVDPMSQAFVSIGKPECDFIVRDSEMNYAYIQVAMTIMNSLETENREYWPFESIRDGYPKYLLAINDLVQKRNGVKHMNIPSLIKEGEMFD